MPFLNMHLIAILEMEQAYGLHLLHSDNGIKMVVLQPLIRRPNQQDFAHVVKIKTWSSQCINS